MFFFLYIRNAYCSGMSKSAVNNSLIAIFSVLVVIIITIFFGQTLYTYIYSFFNQQSGNIYVEAQILYNPSNGQAYLVYTIDNNMNSAINISAIYINDYRLNVSIVVQPYSQYQGTMLLTINVQPGAYYIVIFQGLEISTHKAFSIALNVQPTIV